jgi:hypothetical protein
MNISIIINIIKQEFKYILFITIVLYLFFFYLFLIYYIKITNYQSRRIHQTPEDSVCSSSLSSESDYTLKGSYWS